MPREFETQEEREKYVCKFVTSMWKSGAEETYNDRQRWTLSFNLFQGKQDWSDKEEWQATPFLHEFSKIVRRTSDVLSGLIFQKEDFFNLQPLNPEDLGNAELARIFQKIVRFHLNEMKLSSLCSDFFINGGCTGLGIFKVWIEPYLDWVPEVILEEISQEEDKQYKKLSGKVKTPFKIPEDPAALENMMVTELDSMFEESSVPENLKRKIRPKKNYRLRIRGEVVDPREFVFEPDVKRIEETGYTIEKITKRFYEIESLFETGILEKSKRDEVLKRGHTASSIGAGDIVTYDTTKIQTRDQLPHKNQYAPVVEFLEYFGPLMGNDGRVLEENKHFIVANSDILVKDRRIPYWSQKPPYLYAVFSKSPGKAVGAGVADSGVDHQILTNELFGTFLDMLKLAVYPPMIYDANAIQNPEEVEQGLYPNMFLKSYGGAAKDVFSQVHFDTNVAQVLFQTLERLRVQAESAAGVDVTSANPASRARITAKEVSSNIGRSDDSVLTLGRELDEHFIIPLVQKIVDLTLQFGFELDGLDDLRARGLLTPAEYDLVSNIPKIERFNEIKQRYKVEVKGFRERLERQVFLKNLVDFLNTLKNVPPDVINKIDWAAATYDMVEAFGFDPNRWLYQGNPQDKAREENAILGNNQFISIAEDDPDNLHAPIHYDIVLSSQTQAAIAHLTGHLQRMSMRGEPLPKIPPEVLDLLGVGEEEEPKEKERKPRTEGIRQMMPQAPNVQ